MSVCISQRSFTVALVNILSLVNKYLVAVYWCLFSWRFQKILIQIYFFNFFNDRLVRILYNSKRSILIHKWLLVLKPLQEIWLIIRRFFLLNVWNLIIISLFLLDETYWLIIAFLSYIKIIFAWIIISSVCYSGLSLYRLVGPLKYLLMSVLYNSAVCSN